MQQEGEKAGRFGDCSEQVIGACIEVHRELGPGLLESTYEQCLAHELALRRLLFDKQIPVPVSYKGVALECGYRVDFLVEGELVVEVKAIERLLPVHEAQVITYLKLLGVRTSTRQLSFRNDQAWPSALDAEISLPVSRSSCESL
jgi:GxxExxY protein